MWQTHASFRPPASPVLSMNSSRNVPASPAIQSLASDFNLNSHYSVPFTVQNLQSAIQSVAQNGINGHATLQQPTSVNRAPKPKRCFKCKYESFQVAGPFIEAE